MRYSIEEQTLVDIGDALRRKYGATKLVPSDDFIPAVRVSKTENAKSFTEHEGEYAERGEHKTDIVTIEGATKLTVKIAYQTFSAYSDDYVTVTAGTEPSTAYANRLYGLEITNAELEFDGDTVVFYLRAYDAPQDRNALGYYAEVRGFDADGNPITESGGMVEVKNGFKPTDMAQAIDDIEVKEEVKEFPEEAYIITGNCQYKFFNGSWDWYVEYFKDVLVTQDISTGSNMFTSSKLAEIPFDLNFNNSTSNSINNMFSSCGYLTTIPKINNCKVSDSNAIFNSCVRLREIPEDIGEWLDWTYMESQTSGYSGNRSNMFQNCYSLRKVPMGFINHGNPNPYYAYAVYYNLFSGCYVLDEVVDLPFPHNTAVWSSNAFANTFSNCYRLKRLTFATQEDGTPYSVNWKSQTIDLTNTGHLNGSSAGYTNNITNYNSGITSDKQVKDDETYQALKDDPDWFTGHLSYSRYNHDSAVETINSLPDTTISGGTNIIKFKAIAGATTDGGAINNLTEEEIAVAIAKGWTVTLA